MQCLPFYFMSRSSKEMTTSKHIIGTKFVQVPTQETNKTIDWDNCSRLSSWPVATLQKYHNIKCIHCIDLFIVCSFLSIKNPMLNVSGSTHNVLGCSNSYQSSDFLNLFRIQLQFIVSSSFHLSNFNSSLFISCSFTCCFNADWHSYNSSSCSQRTNYKFKHNCPKS